MFSVGATGIGGFKLYNFFSGTLATLAQNWCKNLRIMNVYYSQCTADTIDREFVTSAKTFREF